MTEGHSEAELRRLAAKAISRPLVTHIYTADPSAHVFEGRLYVYPSHDIDAGIPFDDEGSHFGMEDYHVLRMDAPDAEAEDCGVALHVKDVPWAERQMWAPDAAEKGGRYYLYFPAKGADDRFRIGVAVGTRPEGPFAPAPDAIAGSYSIDPAVFADDGEHYLYFGGLWGGQLQKYRDNVYDAAHVEPAADEPALGPRVARLTPDMKQFAEAPREVVILDEMGAPLVPATTSAATSKAHGCTSIAASTTCRTRPATRTSCAYAVGDDPYGPFVYQGRILEPVVGWTTHHSIVEFRGHWYLYYHDSLLSGGVTHLRSVKVTELHYDRRGRIVTIDPYGA